VAAPCHPKRSREPALSEAQPSRTGISPCVVPLPYVPQGCLIGSPTARARGSLFLETVPGPSSPVSMGGWPGTCLPWAESVL